MGATRIAGRPFEKPFGGTPRRCVTRRERMEPALPSTDDEGVRGHAAAQEVRPCTAEAVTCIGAEGFAGSKPPPDFIGRWTETRDDAGERLPVRVVASKRALVEDVAIDHRGAPLPVAPVLNARDRALRRDAGEPVQGLAPARHPSCGVDAPQPTIDLSARPPCVGESRTKTPSPTGRVVHDELEPALREWSWFERRRHRPLGHPARSVDDAPTRRCAGHRMYLRRFATNTCGRRSFPPG